jgi:hypothetical protein
MEELQQIKIKSFVDANARLIVGKFIDEDDDILKIECPVAIIVKQTQQGGISFSIIPIVFKEILADDSENPVLTYNKSQITMTDVDVFETRIMETYSLYLNNKMGDIKEVDNSSNISEFPQKKVELFDK